MKRSQEPEARMAALAGYSLQLVIGIGQSGSRGTRADQGVCPTSAFLQASGSWLLASGFKAL